MSKKISYFNNVGTLGSEANFEEGNRVEKPALVMVEGKHIDSAKRVHIFDAQRIQTIVDNTNTWLAQGGRVPFQRDHKKDQENNIGDLEGQLEVRVITEADLPSPSLRHLLGKVGAFTSSLVGKGEEIVKEIASKRIKTISPGIDIVANMIKEISATPTPAIVGLGLFKESNDEALFDGDMKALTLADAEIEHQDMSQQKAEFLELAETFWCVMNNILTASEEELQGQDPLDFAENALDEFEERIADMFGLQEDEEEVQPMQQGQGSQMPGYLPRSQGIAPQAAYSMAEVAQAEFAYSNTNPVSGKPRKRTFAGTAGKTAVVGTGVAAATRYGLPAAKAGYYAKKNKLGAIGGAAKKRFGRDLGKVSNTLNRVGTRVGSVPTSRIGVVASTRRTAGSAIKGVGNLAKRARKLL